MHAFFSKCLLSFKFTYGKKQIKHNDSIVPTNENPLPVTEIFTKEVTSESVSWESNIFEHHKNHRSLYLNKKILIFFFKEEK